jgi:Leucine-rich repeat (LRR) protein
MMNQVNNLVTDQHVDLSCLDLTVFSFAHQLIYCRVLQLSGNSLSTTYQLKHLVMLQELHLDDNQLSDLNGLESLTQLAYLSLKRNRLAHVNGFITIKDLPITQLFIADNLLTSNGIAEILSWFAL